MSTGRTMYVVTINGAEHLMMLDPAGVAAYGDAARPAGRGEPEATTTKAAPKPANKSRTARNKTK